MNVVRTMHFSLNEGFLWKIAINSVEASHNLKKKRNNTSKLVRETIFFHNVRPWFAPYVSHALGVVGQENKDTKQTPAESNAGII